MKRILTASIILTAVISAHAQSDFNVKLRELVNESAKCIEGSGNKKVGVWGFFNDAGLENSLGRYMTSKFPIYMSQTGDLEVIDRKNLNLLLKENDLNAEGLIDKNTAKALGKVAALDLIISGTIWIFEDKVELNLFMLDTETATYTCSTEAYFKLNDDLYSLMGIKPPDFNAVNKSRGFNRPLNSNEHYNDPGTVDPKCNVGKGFGDICFMNSTDKEVIVSLRNRDITLIPGQTQCYYGNESIATGSDYTLSHKVDGREIKFAQGEVMIEKCRSKTFVIE